MKTILNTKKKSPKRPEWWPIFVATFLTAFVLLSIVLSVVAYMITRINPGEQINEEKSELGTVSTTPIIEPLTPPTIIELKADTPEPTPSKRYPLTDEERAIVEAVVAAESASESFEGQVLVAQCILNSAEARDMRPDEIVLEKNQYATPRYDLSYMVVDAVSAVFDDGYTVTDEPIRFFYAPKYCNSAWHENSLTFVLSEGGHKFFKLP